jgi:hypothetical protein
MRIFRRLVGNGEMEHEHEHGLGPCVRLVRHSDAFVEERKLRVEFRISKLGILCRICDIDELDVYRGRRAYMYSTSID